MKAMGNKTGMNYLGGKAKGYAGQKATQAGTAIKNGAGNMWSGMTGGGNIKGGIGKKRIVGKALFPVVCIDICCKKTAWRTCY